MSNNLLKLFIIFLLFLVAPIFVSAEGSVIDPNINSCSDYFKLGSVDLQLDSNISNLVSGTQYPFTVDLRNDNGYPVVDGAVYIKIVRAVEDERLRFENGDHVIDNFYITQDITLGAFEEKSINAVWNIPNMLPSGDYYIDAFFVVGGRIPQLGTPNSDSSIGGILEFTVKGEVESIYIDKNKITLNDKIYRFRDRNTSVSESNEVIFRVPIVNETDVIRDISLSLDLYANSTLDEENKLSSEIRKISIAPNSTETIVYKTDNIDYPIYYFKPTIRTANGNIVSTANVFFTHREAFGSLIDFVSIKNYPLVSGEESAAFVCLHNSGSNEFAKDTKIIVSVLDKNEKELYSYMYNEGFERPTRAISSNFVLKRNISNFTVKAIVMSDGNIVDEVITTYDCNDFVNVECKDDIGVLMIFENINIVLIFVTLMIVLIIGFLLYLLFIRKKTKEKTSVDIERITSDPNNQ